MSRRLTAFAAVLATLGGVAFAPARVANPLTENDARQVLEQLAASGDLEVDPRTYGLPATSDVLDQLIVVGEADDTGAEPTTAGAVAAAGPLGDVDGDGADDVVILRGPVSGQVVELRSGRTGDLVSSWAVGGPDLARVAVGDAGDLDGDGTTDLLVLKVGAEQRSDDFTCDETLCESSFEILEPWTVQLVDDAGTLLDERTYDIGKTYHLRLERTEFGDRIAVDESTRYPHLALQADLGPHDAIIDAPYRLRHQLELRETPEGELALTALDTTMYSAPRVVDATGSRTLQSPLPGYVPVIPFPVRAGRVETTVVHTRLYPEHVPVVGACAEGGPCETTAVDLEEAPTWILQPDLTTGFVQRDPLSLEGVAHDALGALDVVVGNSREPGEGTPSTTVIDGHTGVTTTEFAADRVVAGPDGAVGVVADDHDGAVEFSVRRFDQFGQEQETVGSVRAGGEPSPDGHLSSASPRYELVDVTGDGVLDLVALGFTAVVDGTARITDVVSSLLVADGLDGRVVAGVADGPDDIRQVVDLDGDGRPEVLTSRYLDVTARDLDGHVLWQFADMFALDVLGDTDAAARVLVELDGRVEVRRGRDFSLVWSVG